MKYTPLVETLTGIAPFRIRPAHSDGESATEDGVCGET